MRRLLLHLLAATLLSGCVVHGTSRPPPVATVRVHYYGEHALPDGAWCYLDGPHQHEFYPAAPEHYAVEHGYYVWRGPVVVRYSAGHPLPGGAWCMVGGAHTHGFYPPRDDHWVWRPGQGYRYRGPHSAREPPHAGYWARPAPPPARRVPPEAARPVTPRPAPTAAPARPAAPVQAAPAPAAPARPAATAAEPRRDPDAH